MREAQRRSCRGERDYSEETLSKTAAVIAAHPDDEVLGCGGTIAKLAASGWAVHILILAEGVTGRDEARDAAARGVQLDALRATAQRAAAILGARSLAFGGLPDNRMDSVDLLDVVKGVEAFASRVAPQIIFTHGPSDLNVDHSITHRAVLTAMRPLPRACWERLLMFEVSSSTEWGSGHVGPAFIPNWFEDIGTCLQRKLDALAAYDSELRDWPHPRSARGVRTLAELRGSAVGLEAAEAFMLGWHVARMEL